MVFRLKYDLNNGTDHKLYPQRFDTLEAARMQVLEELNREFMDASKAAMIPRASYSEPGNTEYRKLAKARAMYWFETMRSVWIMEPGDKLSIEVNGSAHFYVIEERGTQA